MLLPHNPSKHLRRPRKTVTAPPVDDLADVTILEVPGEPEPPRPPGQGRTNGRTRIINVVEEP